MKKTKPPTSVKNRGQRTVATTFLKCHVYSIFTEPLTKGYPIRIRLDPIIPIPDWKRLYAGIIRDLFKDVKPERITLGTLRFEKELYEQRKEYFAPNLLEMIDKLDIKAMVGDDEGKYSLPDDQRIEIFLHAISEIRKYDPDVPIALCKETHAVWEAVGLKPSECQCVCKYGSVNMTLTEEIIKMAEDRKATEMDKKKEKSKAKKAAKAEAKAEAIVETEPVEVKEKFISKIYEKGKIYDISLDDLKTDNKTQPRKYFDPAELEDLKNSIADKGLIYPIIFRVNDEDEPLLVSGERRVKAFLDLDKDSIPGIYIDSVNYDEIALVDNVQRVNLHPVDEASAVNNLKAKYKYTQEQIGNLIGKAHNTVSDILTLTKLSPEIRSDAVKHSTLSRSSLLKVARKKAAGQKRAYEALIAAITKQSDGVKRPRKELYIRAIDTTDRTIKCIQDINLENLGDNRASVVAKLRELLAEIQNKLGTTAT